MEAGAAKATHSGERSGITQLFEKLASRRGWPSATLRNHDVSTSARTTHDHTNSRKHAAVFGNREEASRRKRAAFRRKRSHLQAQRRGRADLVRARTQPGGAWHR